MRHNFFFFSPAVLSAGPNFNLALIVTDIIVFFLSIFLWSCKLCVEFNQGRGPNLIQEALQVNVLHLVPKEDEFSASSRSAEKEFVTMTRKKKNKRPQSEEETSGWQGDRAVLRG